MTLSEIISLNRKVGADETPTRWRKQTVKGGGLDSVGKHLTRITNQLGNQQPGNRNQQLPTSIQRKHEPVNYLT